MNSDKIYTSLRGFFTSDHNLLNSYLFEWESDIFLLTKSGLTVEIEVKVSRSDFIADFKKSQKHRLLKFHKKQNCRYKFSKYANKYAYNDNGKMYMSLYDSTEVSFCNPQEKIPNRFYYACPEGMIRIEEVPDYAGLIYVKDSGMAAVIKKAPQLHKLKKDWTKDLLDKYFWRNLNSRNEIMNFEYHLNRMDSKDDQISYLKRKLNKVQTILR